MNIINEKNEVLELFKDGKDVVLATSANDLVTTRSVTCLSYNGFLYILSIERPGATKIEQIRNNNNVAINSNTIQITASAELMEYCSDESNAAIMNQYKEKLPEAYNRFALIPSCIVIKMDLKTYKNWKIVDGHIESKMIDFINENINVNII